MTKDNNLPLSFSGYIIRNKRQITQKSFLFFREKKKKKELYLISRSLFCNLILQNVLLNLEYIFLGAAILLYGYSTFTGPLLSP